MRDARIRHAPCPSEAESSFIASGRNNGKRMTSRIDDESVSSIVKPIDADAFAGGRRHAVRQRANVIHIDYLRHFVATLRDLR